MGTKQLTMVAAVCGVVTLLGVLLPWATVDIPPEVAALARQYGGLAKTSVNGTEGDFKGTIVLILGILGGAAAAGAWLVKPGQLPFNARQLLTAALGAFALAWILTLTDMLRSFEGASRGIGLYLAFLATLAGAVAAFLALRQTPAAVAAAAPAA
jgi:hypothetical protein